MSPRRSDALRPALPMNRAVLHRLGLSVGIAIALAGCRTDAEVEAAQRQQAYDNAYRYCINAVTGTFGSASFEVMKECQRQASAAVKARGQ